MQQQHNNIRSVSDIYGTDEIDFLLEEIRDLEPACCQEDLQDFEIAGSRAGEIEISIAATPLELESPLGTCSSWDSHLNYRERLGQSQMAWGGVVLHCDASHLKTPTGIVRILLVISSACCLAFECSAGTVQVSLLLLPLVGRLRLMVFCALFSLLVTCLMLFLDISHIALMFPFNWGKLVSMLNAWLYLTIGLIFILGSSLIIHMVFFAEEFAWVAKYTKDTLFVSAIIGYCCALEAFILAMLACCPACRHRFRRHSLNDDQMGLHDRELSPISSNDIGDKRNKVSNIPNHYNKTMKRSVTDTIREQLEGDNEMPMPNQKPAYIPIKRPDQVFNQKPTLGSMRKNRQGYHYQPIASTSRQSPTFIIDPDDFDPDDEDELIIPINPGHKFA
ncbi:hypothetical protein PVAND_005682 [Polypedilum vanderplanki]|uniref:Uncharacterized protein n=1 Tax=Polypedilum vanderplanki TaxID=319348 RepID=A0A9J6C1X5_POLVA|nr:hypothetical protein PVAND_005682 [Polypedilum vanderplanki]